VDAVFGPYAAEAEMLEQIGAIVRRVRAGSPTQTSGAAVAATAVPLAGRWSW
jgi:hypothetical protein